MTQLNFDPKYWIRVATYWFDGKAKEWWLDRCVLMEGGTLEPPKD